MVNTNLSVYHTSYSYWPVKKVTDTLYDNSGKLNNFMHLYLIRGRAH